MLNISLTALVCKLIGHSSPILQEGFGFKERNVYYQCTRCKILISKTVFKPKGQ